MDFKLVKKIDKLKDGLIFKISRVEYTDGTIDWYQDWEQKKGVDKTNFFSGIGKLQVDYYEERYQNLIKATQTNEEYSFMGDGTIKPISEEKQLEILQEGDEVEGLETYLEKPKVIQGTLLRRNPIISQIQTKFSPKESVDVWTSSLKKID